ncbi:MAG: hypothetical protein HRT71_03990 [Flavobacteriales bacterium]|nr:hypothetical protein [Flavobacteriales bacterium]
MTAPQFPLQSKEFQKTYSEFEEILQVDKEAIEKDIHDLLSHLETIGITKLENIDKLLIEAYISYLENHVFKYDKRSSELVVSNVKRYLIFLEHTYKIRVELN